MIIPQDAKIYIIQSLACYKPPAQIIREVNEQFGFEVPPQNISAYNPATESGSRLSRPHKELFDQVRKKYIEDTSEIPIAQKAHRLRLLQEMLEKPEVQSRPGVMLRILEQAAREVGGAYTRSEEATEVEVQISVSIQEAIRKVYGDAE